MKLTLILLACLLILFVLFMVVTIAFLLRIIIKTAPKDVQERLAGRPAQPVWKTVVGVVLALILLAGIAGVLIYAGYDAVSADMPFVKIFLRFLILFEGYKIFDMVVFDWLLLTKLNVYVRFFPEVEGCESMEKFGFNLKSQIIKIIAFAGLAAVIALVLSRI